MRKKYRPMCWWCGKKHYKLKTKLDGITISIGKCPECGEKRGIIPAVDWEYGETQNPDLWD